jgi:hypothetical protein
MSFATSVNEKKLRLPYSEDEREDGEAIRSDRFAVCREDSRVGRTSAIEGIDLVVRRRTVRVVFCNDMVGTNPR